MKKILLVCLSLALVAPVSIIASPVTTQNKKVARLANEIDKLLAELEMAVDEYASLAPKSQLGDSDATMKLAKVSVQISKLAEKLANNREGMTEAQVARYTSILAKMSNALM